MIETFSNLNFFQTRSDYDSQRQIVDFTSLHTTESFH